MQISCRCDHCGTRFVLDASLAGKKGRCKNCKSVFLIPGVDNDPADVPATVNPAATQSDGMANAAAAESGKVNSPGMETPPTAIPIQEAGHDIPMAIPVPPVSHSAPPLPTTGNPSPPRKNPSAPPSTPPAQPHEPSPNPTVSTSVSSTPPSAPAPVSSAIDIQSRQGSYASRVSRKRERRKLIVTLLGVACVMVCVAGLVLFQSWLAFQTAKTGRLIVEVPDTQRGDVVILIDDEVRVPGSNGRLEVTLNPGNHKIQLRRLGFREIRETINITAGLDFEFHPLWEPDQKDREDG